MNLSELIDFLKINGLGPKKGLSQNFLIDNNIIKKILSLAEVQENDTVLEIGPGPGALTKKILDAKAKIFAVELDSDLANQLERFQNGNLTVIHDNFLKLDLSILPENMKVIANLPYHITTPILEKLFSYPFQSITIMVQKEFAERMQASPGTKNYSSLTLFTKYHAEITQSFHVPAKCFYPAPKVDSTVIRLVPAEKRDFSKKTFFSLVHQTFQKRRKMITSSLNIPKEIVQKALAEMDVRIDARPEMLNFNEWALLSKKFSNLIFD